MIDLLTELENPQLRACEDGVVGLMVQRSQTDSR